MQAYRLLKTETQPDADAERESLMEQLGREIDSCTEVASTYRNKAKKFLASMEVWHIEEIDYEIRIVYEKYLEPEVSEKAIRQYVKGLDRIKQHSVREQMQTLQGRREAMEGLDKQLLFLPYHPDQDISSQFERLRCVDALVWDFRREVSDMLKSQIFEILHYILRQPMNTSDRKEKLTALKSVYEFCQVEQIPDLAYIERKQIDRLADRILHKRKQRQALRMLDQCKKLLFLKAKEINWDANVWYLERFHFESTRVNPASPVRTLSFIEVENKENRRYLQQYMKYCLGVTHLTIGVIQREFTQVRNFAVWLERREAQDIRCVTEKIIKIYFRELDDSDIKEDAFNQIVTSILHFYDYLKVRGLIKKIPFCEQYYLKKVIIKHNNRSVDEELNAEILVKLKYFPEDMRLMFLHLWAIGLRASEVCSLKGNAYYVQGRDAWIRVYQIKMQNYKRIPIPWAIYKLMMVYLKKHQIGAGEYIFKNKKGGACSYGTFRYKMLRCCTENQIANVECLFQSHDYRHTLATLYYDKGVSIQSVRDYLGHDYEEMTRQYIDYMPKKIAKANAEYFSHKENSLASGIKRCKCGK